MKKLILTLIIFLVIISDGNSQLAYKLKWYSVKEALELQKTKPKKLLIDVYTDWCGWCKKMDAETFNHPVIADILMKNFYPVKFNAEGKDSILFGNHTFKNEGEGQRATHQFALALFQAQNLQPAYPTVAYLDERLNLISVIPGYKTAPEMELWLNYVIEEKYKPLPLEEYQKTFKSKIQQ